MTRAALLAVDGGGSKVDAALLRRDGTVLGAARVGTTGFGAAGDEAFLSQIGHAVRTAGADAGVELDGRPVGEVGVFCLAGADLPADDRRIARGLAAAGWASRTAAAQRYLRRPPRRDGPRLGRRAGVRLGDELFRSRPRRADLRFPAMGDISGDWGGGSDLGGMALWHAIRAADGRGEATSLETRVPAHLGYRRPRQVAEAIHADGSIRRGPP